MKTLSKTCLLIKLNKYLLFILINDLNAVENVAKQHKILKKKSLTNIEEWLLHKTMLKATSLSVNAF